MFEVASLDSAAHSVSFATTESYGWKHPKVAICIKTDGILHLKCDEFVFKMMEFCI